MPSPNAFFIAEENVEDWKGRKGMAPDENVQDATRTDLVKQAIQPTQGCGRGVLDGAFRLLRALPDADRGDRQISDLARITGIPRPSVYRLMAQLRAVGAVQRPRGHYVLAQSFVSLAQRVEPVPGLRRQARTMMHALRERTGGTVSLVIPDDQGCSVLDAVPGTEVLPVQVYAGLAMPSTAAAALVLDPRPAPDRVNVVAGWANDHEAVLNDLTCYAVAIRVAGEIEAVLQLSTLSRSPASQFATLTRTAAKRIADALPVTR